MNLDSLTLEDLSHCVQSLNRDILLAHTKALVEKERELTAKTLILFREIENRLIHLDLGYGSLFDLLVHHFSMSEGCASRRVACVRLMSQIPEVEQKIRDGDLSLSNAAAAQRFFNTEARNNHPLKQDEKKEILERLIGKSAREAEKELIQRSSLPIALQIPDQIKPKGDEHVEIRFLAPQNLANLLEEARGLLAHRLPHQATMADLIQALAEMGVEKVKKERFGVGSTSRKPTADATHESAHELSQSNTKESPIASAAMTLQEQTAEFIEGSVIDSNLNIGAEVSTSANLTPSTRSRHIPISIRKTVFLRAEGKCEYLSETTGHRCNSRSFLEFDHQTAFSKGGEHTPECIILACRHHNRLRAVNDFGPTWMNQFRRL